MHGQRALQRLAARFGHEFGHDASVDSKRSQALQRRRRHTLQSYSKLLQGATNSLRDSRPTATTLDRFTISQYRLFEHIFTDLSGIHQRRDGAGGTQEGILRRRATGQPISVGCIEVSRQVLVTEKMEKVQSGVKKRH